MRSERASILVRIAVIFLTLVGSTIIAVIPVSATSGRDLPTLVAGNTAFAFDLYAAVSMQDGNLIVSPYSISEALAMAYAGAAGVTANQISDVLHFDLSRDTLLLFFRSLRAFLLSQDRFLTNVYRKPFELRVANRLWGQAGYGFLPEYLALLYSYCEAGLAETDFLGDPEGARRTINGWISDQTNAKILELIPQGAISSGTSLVLTNAVYLNAAWEYRFEADRTYDETFHLRDGSEIEIPMMHQLEDLLYARGTNWQLVELPYANSAMVMTIILPDEGAFDTAEDAWDAAQFGEMIGTAEPHRVRLAMPRFSLREAFDVTETLAAMGMESAIGPGANFSGMDGTNLLYIDAVIHEAFIDVKEKGTEAAAATAVVGVGSSPPSEPVAVIDLALDRPFLFVLRDAETGSFLFMGRVLDPS